MSGRLVGEVHAWLRTPAARAKGLNPSQRMVLSTIAERANERKREMWSHTGDGCTQFEYLMEVTGLKKSALASALNGLAEKGLEVRIEVGQTRAGDPVFAYRGQATRFRLPVLPASVSLPRSTDEYPPGPVDNSVDEPVDESPAGPSSEEESLRDAGPFEEGSLRDTGPNQPKASGEPDPIGEKASGIPDPSPSTTDPSTTNPSPSVDPSSLAEVEDADPATATPPARPSHHMGWDPDYRDASTYLLTLANEGQEFMDAAAEQLGPTTPIAERVIHAAQAAHQAQEGIPA
jgi:hypothetical protein